MFLTMIILINIMKLLDIALTQVVTKSNSGYVKINGTAKYIQYKDDNASSYYKHLYYCTKHLRKRVKTIMHAEGLQNIKIL